MTDHRWISACLSDVGLVRAVNEDTCKELPEAGVWLVADGMGGHKDGAIASAAVAEAVGAVQPEKRLADLIKKVCERLKEANHNLFNEGQQQGSGIIGSTVAVLILHGRHSACIWVGDSRIYRIRGGVLRRLTRDHRWVEEYVSRGLMTRQAADTHPLANELTRAIGADASLELSIEMRDFLPGDQFLICSDGLYGEISEHSIEDILGGESPADMCRKLVSAAKQNGARDNVTAVVVRTDLPEQAVV